jgi:hypothetical protein
LIPAILRQNEWQNLAVEKTLIFYDFSTDQVDVFGSEKSYLVLMWAKVKGIKFQQVPV